SPDGTEIYTAVNREPDFDRHPDRQHIWAIPVDGGEPRRLSPLELGARAPVPSPDGAWIAFLANDPKELGYDNTKLYLLGRDGRGLRSLTVHRGGSRCRSVVAALVGRVRGEPRWSADGRFIYVVSSVSGVTVVLRIDVATGEAETVAWERKAAHAFRLGGQR